MVANYSRMSGFSRKGGKADPALSAYNAPITGTKTTNVHIRSEPAFKQPAVPLKDMPARNGQYPRPAPSTGRAYNCEITGGEGSAGPSNTQSHRVSYHDVPMPLDPKEKFRFNANEIPSSSAGTSARAPVAQPQPVSHRHNTHSADQALKIMGTVALFFFFIMLGTWIPSSANRLYSVVHPKRVSLTLEYAAAVVLPMQGFWNCIIYMLMSRAAVKNLWKNVKERRQWTVLNISDTIRDAFTDTSTIRRPNSSRTATTRASTARTSTAVGTGSRPYTPRVFQSEDDSATLLEDLDPARPGAVRPNAARSHDFDQV